jgi:hypothetical protein
MFSTPKAASRPPQSQKMSAFLQWLDIHFRFGLRRQARRDAAFHRGDLL